MDAPLDAPEKRPSVIRATLSPSPIPAMAEVGFNISLMPGPPFGPSYLMTTTSPGTIFPPFIAVMASSSQSNTLAGPLCTNISSQTADLFTILPFGARFPLSAANPPVSLYGLSIGLIVLMSLFSQFTIFSLTVFPVAVIKSVYNKPFLSSSFITAYTPPASFKSSI